MYILGISTINRQGSVALVSQEGTLIAEAEIQDTSSLSRTLVPEVSRMLSAQNVGWDAVRLLAFTWGPGSFTSLRIGLAAVKGLVFGRDIPVVGVSSLESLAAGLNISDGIAVPLLDARKGEVYCGIYSIQDGETKSLLKDFAEKPEVVVELVKKECPDAFLFGDGLDKYSDIFTEFQEAPHKSETAAYQTALLGMKKGKSDQRISLRYCRSSEAEVHKGISIKIK